MGKPIFMQNYMNSIYSYADDGRVIMKSFVKCDSV